jgi:hypothetical protein
MKMFLTTFVCASLTWTSLARADEPPAEDPAVVELPGQPPEAVQPGVPAPTQLPPAPPVQPPAPPQGADQQQAQAPGVPAEGAAPGQWVYTSQYGWVFMPYGDQYTYEGTAYDESPYSYVYYPNYGWLWLASPWVWGWGPYPNFGVWGPGRFGWYHGLFRGGWGWGRYRGGGPWNGAGGPRAGYAGAAHAGVRYGAPLGGHVYRQAPVSPSPGPYGGYHGGNFGGRGDVGSGRGGSRNGGHR